MRLGNGRTWRIRAEGAPASNYVQSLSINGRAHDVPWVAYDDIANGATLHFAMGSTPSQWGSRKQPPSFGVPVAVNAVDSYNNRGFSADGATNADGRGLRRQPVQLLAECAGSGGRAARQAVRGGRRERRGGGPFSLDNTVTVGQTVMLPPGSAGTGVVVLGSANNGPSSGTAQLNFADGSSQAVTLAFDDWTLNGGSAHASATVAVTMAYRNSGSGQQDNVKTYIFAQKIPVPPARW